MEQLQSNTYMRKGFLIYEETCKYFPIYEEAISIWRIWRCNFSILNFLIYEENLIIFFISVLTVEVLRLFIIVDSWKFLFGLDPR